MDTETKKFYLKEKKKNEREISKWRSIEAKIWKKLEDHWKKKLDRKEKYVK